MPPKISAFPKCYLDTIAGARTMSVFDWIDMARSLDADGLEMYDGFFTSLDGPYLDSVGEAIRNGRVRHADAVLLARFHQSRCRWPQTGHRARNGHDRRDAPAGWPRAGVPGAERAALSRGAARTGARVGGRVHQPMSARRPRARHRPGTGEPLQGRLLEVPRVRPEEGRFSRPARRHSGAPSFRRAIRSLQRRGRRRRSGRFAAAVADRVVSMHASDRYLAEGASLDDLRQTDGTSATRPNLRHGVTGKGLNDYDSIFRILAEHDYQGWISIEDGMNGMEEMAESLAFLRQHGGEVFCGVMIFVEAKPPPSQALRGTEEASPPQ